MCCRSEQTGGRGREAEPGGRGRGPGRGAPGTASVPAPAPGQPGEDGGRLPLPDCAGLQPHDQAASSLRGHGRPQEEEEEGARGAQGDDQGGIFQQIRTFLNKYSETREEGQNVLLFSLENVPTIPHFLFCSS